MPSAFSHSLRILTCASCGGPIEGALAGGVVRCSYCGAENGFAPRDEREALTAAAQPLTMSEMERVGRLREQKASEAHAEVPPSLSELVDPEGRPRVDRMDFAKRRWLVVRGDATRAPTFATSEQLLLLTTWIVPCGKPGAERAILETAIELVSDDGHRYILRCLLARYAAAAGELDAAEEWLALCHPRPLELRMDTAYRLAAATLAMVRDDLEAVLSTLAEGTPLSADFEVDCALLRIHALDLLGRRDDALAECARLTASEGQKGVIAALRRAVPAGVGTEVCFDAFERDKEAEVAELERRLRDGDLAKRAALRTGEAHVPWPVSVSFVVAGAPLVVWLFLFVGTGETGNWNPGPLSNQPDAVVIPALVVAVLAAVAILGAGFLFARSSGRARVRAEIEGARAELEQLQCRRRELLGGGAS